MTRITLFRSSLIILIIYLVIVAFLATILPADASIPIHWNARGEIDGWASRTTAVVFALALNAAFFLLMYLMPWYSPKYRKQQKRFDSVLPRMTNILLIFFGLVNIYGLSWPLGAKQLPANPILLILGLLFALIGNLLPKVPRNFFVGIRTPWSITDEDNWYKTHRLGAWLFVIGGILMMLIGLLPLSSNLVMIGTWSIIAIMLFPVLYSFILFRKSQ
jgi:uncharacterized membrane protein